jgi:hypothetical protein
MPSPRSPVRWPPALEAAVQEPSRTAGTPWATRRAEAGGSRATILRYLHLEMCSKGRRQYCMVPQPPGRKEERDDDQSRRGGPTCRLPRL